MTSALFQLQNLTGSDSISRPTEVVVSGEIDVTNADDFVQSVTELFQSRPVILDMSRLDYLDSAGFAALDRLLERGAVIVVSPESVIHRAAKVMELPFHHDLEAARRVLKGA